MSFSKSAVTGYVQANEKELAAKAILMGKTASLVGFQPDVKGTAQLNTLVDGVTLQAGGCGWNAAGTTTLSKRNIVTGQIKVNEALCEKDLIGTYAEWGVKTAVGKTSLPFEELIANTKVKAIQEKVENLIWQGDTAGNTSTYFDLVDGLIKTLNAEGTVINATLAGKTLTGNTIEVINAIVAGIPNLVIDAEDLTIFAGYEVVRAYIAAYNASNQFAGTLMLDGATMSVTVPNTSIKLQGVTGLNGKNKAYATPASNIVIGGDVAGDDTKFLMWYSEDNSEFRFKSEFNLGVQVRFPDYVVKYIL